MKKPNNNYHHGDLSASVINHAHSLIVDKGIAALNMRAIARDIGVDSAAIYRHFKSKDIVAAHVARRGFENLAQQMLQSLAGHDDAVERVVLIGKSYIGFALDQPHLFEMMFHVANNPDYKTLECENDAQDSPMQIFSQAWQDLLLQKKLPISNAQQGQFSLWCSVHGFATLLINGHGPKEPDAIIKFSEATCRAMINGLLSEG